MANPIAYLWDKAVRLYRNLKGKFVQVSTIRKAIDDFGDSAKKDLDRLAREFQSGSINASAFSISAKAAIKNIHVAAGTIAVGGRYQLTPKVSGQIGAMVKSEYGYFDAMMREVNANSQPLDGTFLARVAMYGAAGTKTFEKVTRKANEASGDYDEERRVLHSGESCRQCREYAARGWVAMGTLPDIGASCSCHSNCKCSLEYRMASQPSSSKPRPGKVAKMSDLDSNLYQDLPIPDDLVAFIRGGGKGGKSSGGKGGDKVGSTGDRWITLFGRKIFVKGGKLPKGALSDVLGKKHGHAKIDGGKSDRPGLASHKPLPKTPLTGHHAAEQKAHETRVANKVKKVDKHIDHLKGQIESAKGKLADHQASHAKKSAVLDKAAHHAKAHVEAVKAKKAELEKQLSDHAVKRAKADQQSKASQSAHDKKIEGLKGKHEAAKAKVGALKAAGPPVRSVKTSAPRDKHEVTAHAGAKANGKSAMVVTSRPTYHAGKTGDLHTHHVGGRQIASHRKFGNGYQVTIHHSDGTSTTHEHANSADAREHLLATAQHEIAKGTTRHVVTGDSDKLRQFDAAKHGLIGQHRKATARILGHGEHVKFSEDEVQGEFDEFAFDEGAFDEFALTESLIAFADSDLETTELDPLESSDSSAPARHPSMSSPDAHELHAISHAIGDHYGVDLCKGEVELGGDRRDDESHSQPFESHDHLLLSSASAAHDLACQCDPGCCGGDEEWPAIEMGDEDEEPIAGDTTTNFNDVSEITSPKLAGFSAFLNWRGPMGLLALFREWTSKDREELSEEDYGEPETDGFPIEDQADVDAAVHLIGKASDPDAVKKRIKAIAKRKGLDIPEAWQDTAKMSDGDGSDFVDSPLASLASHWAAFDAELNNRVEDGDHVRYIGAKLFKVGSYADKGFSLTRDEAASTVSQFTSPVPLELEHINSSGVRTFLDDEYGHLEAVRLSSDGDWIVGDVKLDPWVDRKWDKYLAKAGEAHKQVSCVLDRGSKAIGKLGMVIRGRVDGAALTAAFSATHRDDDSAIDALFSNALFTNASFAKDRTMSGQRMMQEIHDRTASAGAMCEGDPAFAAILFHSAPELASLQKMHNAACDGGAKCQVYSRDEMDKRGVMFAELATFTPRKKHEHADLTHQALHDVIAVGYPAVCSGGPMMPAGSPGMGANDASPPMGGIATMSDTPEQMKSLKKIHSMTKENGAMCPGAKSAKMSGSDSLTLNSQGAISMSKVTLTAAIGALPDDPASITEDQAKAVLVAFTAILPDNLKPKLAAFSAPTPEPESEREKSLRLKVEGIEAERETERRNRIESAAETFSLDLFTTGKLLPKAVPFAADLYRELADDDHQHAKTVSFGAEANRKTGGRLALFSAFASLLPKHGLFDPAITGASKLEDIEGASVLFNKDGMPVDRDSQPSTPEQLAKNLSYTDLGKQILNAQKGN